jgi:streptogramin lyase
VITMLALVGQYMAGGSRAYAITVSQEPLPERCGGQICKPSPATAILSIGPNRLLAAGITKSLYDVVTMGSGGLTVSPGPGGNPAFALTIGPDGNPWALSSKLGSKEEAIAVVEDVTPGGVVTRYERVYSSGDNEVPLGLASGQGAAWLLLGGRRIVRVSPNGEAKEIIDPEPNPYIVGITAGPDERMYFTDMEDFGAIGTIMPSGELTLEPLSGFSSPEYASPKAIAPGPEQTVWFTEPERERVVEMLADGERREIVIPDRSPADSSARPSPKDIVEGPEGDMYFTDPGDNAVGRVTVGGEVTEYPVPSLEGVAPDEIALVGDELVFNEFGSASLGMVDPAGTPSAAPLTSPPPRAEVQAALAQQISRPLAPSGSTALRRAKGTTVTFVAPEPGTLAIEVLAQELAQRSKRQKRSKRSKQHKLPHATPKTVVIATGSATFNLAETKMLAIAVKSTGEQLLKANPRLRITIRAAFTGRFAGPLEATDVQQLHR